MNIALRDYASSKGISYEAVRKQVNRYKMELDGHIFKIGRTQHLDEFAVQFLDEKRQANPVIVYDSNKDEELRRLTDENKALLLRINELQDRLLASNDTIQLLQQEKIQLLEERNKAPEEQRRWWQFWKR